MKTQVMWFVHSAIAHPLMALCQAVGLNDLGTKIHDSTVPDDGKKIYTSTKVCDDKYSRECQTPGTTYRTVIHGNRVFVEAVLPEGFDLSESTAKDLERRLHDSMEGALKHFF